MEELNKQLLKDYSKTHDDVIHYFSKDFVKSFSAKIKEDGFTTLTLQQDNLQKLFVDEIDAYDIYVIMKALSYDVNLEGKSIFVKF